MSSIKSKTNANLIMSNVRIDQTTQARIRLWCLTPLLSIFQLFRGGQFYFLEKTGVPKKTTDQPEATDSLYHII
jgi:hypothetical protein